MLPTGGPELRVGAATSATPRANCVRLGIGVRRAAAGDVEDSEISQYCEGSAGKGGCDVVVTVAGTAVPPDLLSTGEPP